MLRDAFKDLLKNDPIRMAGATSFFTAFALPPILIILIEFLGIFFGRDAISAKLFERLAAIIQKESAIQIGKTLKSMYALAQNWFISIGGFIFLLLIATTLFKVIQGSLNQLWRIKGVKERKLWVVVRSKVQSVLVILMAGILFLPGALADNFSPYTDDLERSSSAFAYYLHHGFSFIISVVIVMLWFAIVFRYLPDARPEWRVALTGAFLTSVFFNIGKLVLRWLFAHTSTHKIYGSSGAIVLLLLFVFYTSLILYYGAVFTKIWGEYHERPILPLPHATQYKVADQA